MELSKNSTQIKTDQILVKQNIIRFGRLQEIT